MNQFLIFLQISLVVLLVGLNSVDSHGRLMNPIARGSRWRTNSSAPADYNDNEGFCGGYGIQHGQNNGKCGLCGNSYADATPRRHELGGIYGEGVIVANYQAGVNSELNVDVLLTANHRGYFMFDLCNIDESTETSECFAKHQLELKSGGYKYQLQDYSPAWFNTTVKIPDNFNCNHCVFRWTYITGNTWGTCSDGTSAVGCGPQENFVGCADISITL